MLLWSKLLFDRSLVVVYPNRFKIRFEILSFVEKTEEKSFYIQNKIIPVNVTKFFCQPKMQKIAASRSLLKRY